MRLRDEDKLKEKLEVRLNRHHILYLFLFAALFFAAVFFTGLLMGKNDPAKTARAADADQLLSQEASKVRASASSEDLPGLESVARLSIHPETIRPFDRVQEFLAYDRMDRIQERARQTERIRIREKEKYLEERQKVAEEETLPPMDEARKATSESHRVFVKGKVDPGNSMRVARAPEMPPAQAEAPPPKTEVVQKSSYLASMRKDPEEQKAAGEVKVIEDRPYLIQAKSFPEKKQAEDFAQYLRSRFKDYPKKALRITSPTVFITEVDLPNKGGTWHRVRVGYFRDRNEAESFKRIMEKEEGFETFIAEK